MKKLLLLLLSAILFTSCDEEPEDVNKYKGCVVMEKKMPFTIEDSYEVLYIKLTPTLKKSQLDKNNVRGDFYRLVVYKLDSKNLNVGDTIK